MKKKTICLFLTLVGLGAFGKFYAIAQTKPPIVEPIMEVEAVSVKSGELDPSAVKVKGEGGKEITLEEKIRGEITAEMDEREKVILEREKAAVEKEETLKAVEARVDVKVGELKDIGSDIEAAVGLLSKHKKEDKAKLSNMYANMKAKDAAAIINTMDVRMAVEIIDGMSPSAAGSVLGLMEPKRARDVTNAIFARGDQIAD
jgi:flagellar motility protein MotE (MotC chaperone)